MIAACLSCVSDMAIIPMADWLHLGAEARINTPQHTGLQLAVASDHAPDEPAGGPHRRSDDPV